jgi:hypothetical protein
MKRLGCPISCLRLLGLSWVSLVLIAGCVPSEPTAEATLVGWATLPADVFVPGPTSGQFIEPANGRMPPFVGEQPVQGFSALLLNDDGTLLALSDNGFGSRENSPDHLLQVWTLRPDFRTAEGGSGAIEFELAFVLSDPHRHVPFPLVADREHYPGSEIPVDSRIREGRWLTGGDFDVESVRRAPDGSLYFGDEFGPFLLHTDPAGVLLEAPIPIPGIQSPQNPHLADARAWP